VGESAKGVENGQKYPCLLPSILHTFYFSPTSTSEPPTPSFAAVSSSLHSSLRTTLSFTHSSKTQSKYHKFSFIGYLNLSCKAESSISTSNSISSKANKDKDKEKNYQDPTVSIQ